MADGLDILVVSQFFTPEMGAPAARFHDFGRLLVARGHRVRIITGFPHFPSMSIPEPYRGRIRQHEEMDGVEVHRGWMFASPRWPAVSKPLGYASFVASASAQALFGRLPADVVIATSPPPTVAIPGILAARRRRVPLVFDVRDIWPEAIVESGRVRNPLIVRPLEAIERWVYRTAAAVTVVTEGKRERMLEKGVAGEKLEVVPNGVDLSRFDHSKDVSGILDAAGVGRDRFRVIYAGIFGPSQGLGILLDALHELERTDPESHARIQLVWVGAGVERPKLEARIAQEGLEDHVRFVGEQPRERIPSLLRSADAVSVTLRARRDTHTVPSKIYEAIASGRPVLVSANGAPGEILDESGAGIATPAGDAKALADSLRTVMTQSERARRFGEQGVAHARHFDRRELVNRLETLLERLVRAHRGRGA